MKFFVRSNRVMSFLHTLPLWLLYSGFFSILLISALLWYFFVIAPLDTWAIWYQMQQKQLQGTITQSTNKQSSIDAVKMACEHIKKDIATLQHIASVDERLAVLFGMIEKNGIELETFEPLNQINKKLYSKKQFRYVLKGSYEQLMSLMKEICESKLFIRCKEFFFQALSDQKIMRLTLRLDIIYFPEIVHEAINKSGSSL